MYPHGPYRAKAVATWDSVINMQMMAYVDPASAWNAFTGMLSLVNADGQLGDADSTDGENLPAREAQTAWNLYSITGDLAKLRAVYPAIRRLLDFKEKTAVDPDPLITSPRTRMPRRPTWSPPPTPRDRQARPTATQLCRGATRRLPELPLLVRASRPRTGEGRERQARQTRRRDDGGVTVR